MSEKGVLAGLADSAFLAGLGRRDKSPWRILAAVFGGVIVGLVAALACVILAWIVYIVVAGQWREGVAGLGRAAVALKGADGKDLRSAILLMVTAVATNGPFVLAFVALAAILTGHRLRDFVTAAPAFRWRLLLAGLLLSVVVVAPVMVADHLFSKPAAPMPLLVVSQAASGRAIYVAAAVVLLIAAAGAEELLLRGWLLRQVAAFSRSPIVLIGFTAVVFSCLHFDFAIDAFVTRALMGAGFAYMTLRLGGIEFSTGAHAANNILIVLFIEPLTLKTAAAAGDLSLASVLEDVALVVGYIVITEAMARLTPLRRWAGVKAGEVTAPPSAAAPRR
jgi:membrane protease YdiL (CAAX protease family)